MAEPSQTNDNSGGWSPPGGGDWASTTGNPRLDAVLMGRDPDAVQNPSSQQDGTEGNAPAAAGRQDTNPADQKHTAAMQDSDPLASSLSFDETPDQRLQRISTENETLRSTHTKLEGRIKAVDAWLEDQGIELMERNGKVTPVLKDGRRNPSVSRTPAPKFEDLDEETQQLFEGEYQAAIDKIWGQAKETLGARVQPVAERPPEPPTEEAVASMVESLAAIRDVDGTERVPRLKENMPYIRHMLADAAAKGLDRLWAENPRLAMELLNDRVEQRRARIEAAGRANRQREDSRAAAASSTPSYGPSSGGQAPAPGESGLSEGQRMAKAIANA